MKTKLILFCIINGISLTIGQAQNTKIDTITSPKLPTDTYGLRVGVDLVKPLLGFTINNFKGVELVADYRLSKKWFVASEFGNVNRDLQKTNYQFNTQGNYITLGANYNFHKNWVGMDNEIYMGTRYGYSQFNSTLENYTINQNGNYFDKEIVSSPINFSNLNAHWVSYIMGLKVETFKNLYLGFMFSLSKMVTVNNPSNFETSYVPGVGKISKNGSGSNINYTISYKIPIYKK